MSVAATVSGARWPRGALVALGVAGALAGAPEPARGIRFTPLVPRAAPATVWCSEPAWSPNGRWLAWTRAVLDEDAGDFVSSIEIHALDGEPAPEFPGLDHQRLASHATWSPSGRRLAWTTADSLCVIDLAGTVTCFDIPKSVGSGEPDWSPDGTRIAYKSAAGGSVDLWVLDLRDGSRRRLTHGHVDATPDWSPDGRQLAFASRRQGNLDVYVIDADGTHLRRLTADAADDSRPTWSPDGRFLAFTSTRRGASDIWVIPAAGGSPTLLIGSPHEDLDPDWSPDGKRLAFASTRSGELRIWVAADLPDPHVWLRDWRLDRRPLR